MTDMRKKCLVLKMKSQRQFRKMFDDDAFYLSYGENDSTFVDTEIGEWYLFLIIRLILIIIIIT